jgi:hypothetical protein
MATQQKTYELMVMLAKQEPLGLAEWHESTLVEAGSIAEAKKLALEFAKIEAGKHGAKVTDCYAQDLETSELSD